MTFSSFFYLHSLCAQDLATLLARILWAIVAEQEYSTSSQTIDSRVKALRAAQITATETLSNAARSEPTATTTKGDGYGLESQTIPYFAGYITVAEVFASFHTCPSRRVPLTLCCTIGVIICAPFNSSICSFKKNYA